MKPSYADRDIVATVQSQAAAAGLVGADRAVIAMVSGGRDSLCLLDVATTLCGPGSVLALHVNYGLREGADGDQQLCAEVCARLGVRLESVRAQRPDGAAGNLQAWARDLRYAAATRLALANDAIVATGHTASDQVETVLYRLAASPGRRALLGMAPREGRLLRPLLTLTREQTAGYCHARGLLWRDDETNDSDYYVRGRTRRGLVPALRALHPAAEANVLRTAALLREEAAVLDELVAEALGGRDAIALSRLAQLPRALARLVLARLAEDAAGRPAGGVGARLDDLLALQGRGGSSELHLGSGLRAVVEYGLLCITAGSEELRPEPVALAIPGQVRFGSWLLTCAPAPAELDLSGAATTGATAALDAQALGEHALIRCWRVGDRMRPAGLGGTKTLADLFGNRRVARAQRATLPIVEVDGAIAWVPGIAVDERFAIGAQTSSVVTVSARRIAPEALDTATATTTLAADRVSQPVISAPIVSAAAPVAPVSVSDLNNPAIGDVLVSAEDLQRRVRDLGREISLDYAGRSLLLVGVLKGAVFFLSDLMRWIDVPVEVDFMAVASYGSATDSSGVVRILKDLDVSIEGRDVLIVEDIVDSGLTLHYLLRNLRSRNPSSLEVCALLTKPERRRVDLPTRYVGFEIPHRFAIGYGLDHAERYRNLPYIAALNEL